MPATRLRNQDWQGSLRQVLDRGGSLEVAIAAPAGGPRSSECADFLWRVRLLAMTATELVVESPAALGREMPLQDGVELICVFAIGQNRWMFRARNLGRLNFAGPDDRRAPAIRVSMPDVVERCQRRSHYRVETASLTLPNVDVWPLLDPQTVVVAERANELSYQNPEPGGGAAPARDDEAVLPDIGLRFAGKLLNLGGGGVGLLVRNDESQALFHHKLFWLRIGLPPELHAPICATAKCVHTHMGPSQDYYVGLAFDFTFNPAHQEFVVEQISRYVALQQRAQMMAKSA